jgi:energy-coupling factor transporter ATP-binding protein EcfA2
VWVPGREPVVARVAGPAARPELLTAQRLGVARVPRHPLPLRVDVELAGGSVLALTGPNGVGKSTLALTLGGLLAPASGAVLATAALTAGVDPRPIRWRSRELLTRIGTVFQNPEHQFVAATVREELAIGPRALRLSDSEIGARVDSLLDRLGLAALAGANPFTLSGGQKRRLSVAAVLASRPRVLVLDEPTFGQDAVTWAALVSLLDELRGSGTAIVAATHDIRFIEAIDARELALTGVAA